MLTNRLPLCVLTSYVKAHPPDICLFSVLRLKAGPTFILFGNRFAEIAASLLPYTE